MERRFNRNSGFDNRSGGFDNREKHKAVCDECKQPCEVPFKPMKGKPVYCQECYKKKKGF